MQEIRNQKMIAEQTKADLTLARNNHQEETARLQQDIQILRVNNSTNVLVNILVLISFWELSTWQNIVFQRMCVHYTLKVCV